MKQKAKLFFLNVEPQYSKNMSIKLEFRTYEKYMSLRRRCQSFESRILFSSYDFRDAVFLL